MSVNPIGRSDDAAAVSSLSLVGDESLGCNILSPFMLGGMSKVVPRRTVHRRNIGARFTAIVKNAARRSRYPLRRTSIQLASGNYLDIETLFANATVKVNQRDTDDPDRENKALNG